MPRKVILGFGIRLDDYIARRNGDLDFLVIDKEGEALIEFLHPMASVMNHKRDLV